jgi:hypothetical protein
MSVKELDLFHSSLVFKMGNVSLLFFSPHLPEWRHCWYENYCYCHFVYMMARRFLLAWNLREPLWGLRRVKNVLGSISPYNLENLEVWLSCYEMSQLSVICNYNKKSLERKKRIRKRERLDCSSCFYYLP